MKKRLKMFLSVMLVFAMLFSFVGTAAATDGIDPDDQGDGITECTDHTFVDGKCTTEGCNASCTEADCPSSASHQPGEKCEVCGATPEVKEPEPTQHEHQWEAGECKGEGTCPGCSKAAEHGNVLEGDACSECKLPGTKKVEPPEPEHKATDAHALGDFGADGKCTKGCGLMLEQFRQDCTHDWSEKDGVCVTCGAKCPNEAKHGDILKGETCTPCGFVGNKEPVHEHTPAATWSSNETHHWKACTAADCPDKNDATKQEGYGAHTFGTDGICTVCEYEHQHKAATAWQSNATEHWHGCADTNCPTAATAKLEAAAHTFNGTVTCAVCGYVHQHQWSTTLEKDATQHWQVCTDRDCPVTGVKNAVTAHAYDATGACACGAKKPHEHTWATGDTWGADETHHWRVCTGKLEDDSACSEKTDVALHDFGADGALDECSVCGTAKPAGYEVPTHVWDTEWTTEPGSESHWHACIEEKDPACTEKNDVTAHTYDATTGKCVCGAEKPHEHTWATGNTLEDWGTSATHHWRECTDEKCPDNTAQNAYAEHAFGAWTTVKEATETEAGSQKRECSVCHYVQTEVIPATGGGSGGSDPDHTHAAATDWSSDASGHWHACTVAGCTEKLETASHTYGAWIVDTNATATQAGSRHRVCTVCEYRQTEAIPATGGSSGGGSGGGSSSGGGSGGSNTSGTTTKNPDGSTTTTTTNKTTGAVTETTKKPDGSTVVTTTQKDGATETVTTTANGVVATTATSTTGQTTVEVKLPAAVVTAAGNTPVPLPIEKVPATRSLATAPTITVTTGATGNVKVAIPTTSTAPGVVAVIVKPDGSTEVVKTSVMTSDGVVAALPNGATVKVVDNSKAFADVSAGNWSGDAVAFVSARGLFAGTSSTTFAPNAPMTHAMMTTVLARLAGADLSGGDTWYAKSLEWAAQNGISGGTDPGANVSREQLVAMIWRYAGTPAAMNGLSEYPDANEVSDYADEAMRWAVENGILSGADGHLVPHGQASRAEVAQILQNYIISLGLGK